MFLFVFIADSSSCAALASEAAAAEREKAAREQADEVAHLRALHSQEHARMESELAEQRAPLSEMAMGVACHSCHCCEQHSHVVSRVLDHNRIAGTIPDTLCHSSITLEKM